MTMPRVDFAFVDPRFQPPAIPGWDFWSNYAAPLTAAEAQERAERHLPERAVVRVEPFAPVPDSDVRWAVYVKLGTGR